MSPLSETLNAGTENITRTLQCVVSFSQQQVSHSKCSLAGPPPGLRPCTSNESVYVLFGAILGSACIHVVTEQVPINTNFSLRARARAHAHALCVRHTCMHACMHACIHTYMHTYIHTCMHACMHPYIHTCMHTSESLAGPPRPGALRPHGRERGDRRPPPMCIYIYIYIICIQRI